ncbi:MAG: carboxypeptidase-like regulatory domain-containing protein, partial [Pyrinomonadaceae bacterium]
VMKFHSKMVLLTAFFAVFCAGALAQNTGGVKGKVRTNRNESIEKVSVTARRDGKDIKTVLTDAKGEFILEGLSEGDYNFTFGKNGFTTGIHYNVEVKKNKIRNLGDRLILNIDQGTQVIIRGVVFDEQGRSVRGANIEIQKKQTDGSFKKVAVTTSSYGIEPLATGEFIFRFPESGGAEYRITASAKNVSESKEISVTTAAVYRLALTLKVQQ